MILCTRRSSNSASFNGFAASMNPILYVLRNTTFAYSASCPESVTVKAKLRQPVAVIHYNPLHRRSWLLLNLLNSLLGFIDFCKSKAALSYHQSFSNNNHSTPHHLINSHFIPTGTAIYNKISWGGVSNHCRCGYKKCLPIDVGSIFMLHLNNYLSGRLFLIYFFAWPSFTLHSEI